MNINVHYVIYILVFVAMLGVNVTTRTIHLKMYVNHVN